MKFTPKSDGDFESEAAERQAKYLWPNGTIVDYEVNSAVQKTSKKGNDMLELSVTVYNSNGDKQTITDWIGEWNLFKLKHICEANGLDDKYFAGEVSDTDLYYKTGKARIGVQKGSAKDDGSFYADKNNIADYLKPSGEKAIEAKGGKISKSDLDDEIPF